LLPSESGRSSEPCLEVGGTISMLRNAKADLRHCQTVAERKGDSTMNGSRSNDRRHGPIPNN